jgi:hemoglobin
MKFILPLVVAGSLTSFTLTLQAAEAVAGPPAKPAVEEVNKLCPVTGKPADPKITTVYEGKTYAFSAVECRTKWTAARDASLYHKLGGKPAIDAAVELFYKKVLADDRIKHFFDDINMNAQRRKQKAFLSAAFGGPEPWTGKDLRKAHENIPGLNESHFNAVAENLKKTLEELKVPKDLIGQVMAIAASARNAVLNRKPTAK